jgi:RimJ/RimL family protein N-acetyltransferase
VIANIGACVLEGEVVRLEPLRAEHADALLLASADGELGQLWYTSVPSAQTMASYLATALEHQSLGRALPFIVRLRACGTVVGSTRYCNIDAAVPRLEIGYTWYAKRVQRSQVNTECKLLLLRHAFEQLEVAAVELRTHFFNHASRRAIERLGAKLDGILRQHMRMPDGTLRDTVVYSILNHEWPTVQRHLRHLLSRPA